MLSINEPQSLQQIADELARERVIITDEKAVDNLLRFSSSQRVRDLLEKRRFLKLKQQAIATQLQGIPQEEKPEAQPENNGTLAAFFDVIKKLIDLSDDAWNAAKGAMPENMANSVGPFIVGGVGGIVHFREGYEGVRQFHEAYTQEQIGQRKTRLVTAATTVLFAATGVALSAVLLAGAAGAAVAGMFLLPTLICGFLTGIYSLALWRKSYIFNRAKALEEQAQQVYDHYKKHDYVYDIQHADLLKKHLTDLEAIKKTCVNENIENILFKREKRDILSSDESKVFEKYVRVTHELITAQSTYAAVEGRIEGQQKRYDYFREQRLKAEREVAFGTIEVTASVLVLIGTILMTAAIVGASIASFGIAPFAVLVTGVVLGFVSKLFENRDEKNQYAHSRKIRNWFTDQWTKLKNCFSPEPEKTISHCVTQAKSPSSTARVLPVICTSPVSSTLREAYGLCAVFEPDSPQVTDPLLSQSPSSQPIVHFPGSLSPKR